MLRPFAVLALVVVISNGSPAVAQDSWPSKPITVIVPFGAGGAEARRFNRLLIDAGLIKGL